MQIDLQQAFADLYKWCREHEFAGHDPFDALNSRLFQNTPLKQSRGARLGWTQLLKRSPLDLRRIARVPREKNPKGIALFALATLAQYRRTKTAEAESITRGLLGDLAGMKLTTQHGAAWGYNFDWQSRVFLAEQGTPTIVPTAFAARAFIEGALAFEDQSYAKLARSVCDFILEDLNRSVDTETEVCFSYSPNSPTRIYNASLLAAETLASVAALMKEPELCATAVRAVRYVVKQQHVNGSWSYGAESNQAWVDNFHTAFLLSSLWRIIRSCEAAKTEEFQHSLRRGYEYWRATFFLADGWPKYYDDSPYPADAHAAATAIATLCDLSELDEDALPLARKIASWTIEHLRDPGGFFYYQRRRFYTVRIPFMRWSEAWMLYGLGRLLEESKKFDKL